MFIYTVKASRLKFFALLICSMAILLTLAAVIPNEADYESVAVVAYDYSNVNSNEDRVLFLKSFGYEVESKPSEAVNVTIPEQFDGVYTKYNDIQRAQGLNLKRYSGKEVQRYTYKITNYNGCEDDVVANILVYNNNVVAGDVCCVGNSPFIHGFELPD